MLKMTKLQKRSLITNKLKFFWKWGFRKVLDNIELSPNMKIKKILMTGSTDMGRDLMPLKWGFPQYLNPKCFLQKRAVSPL